MRFSIAALAVLTATAHAFKDTSPFILFSSSPLPSNLQAANSRQLRSSFEVLNNAKDILGQCSSDVYFFIQQPGVSAPELAANAPHLRNALSSSTVGGRYAVNEVVGLNAFSTRDLAKYVNGECKASQVKASDALSAQEEGKKVVVVWDYDSLSNVQRARDGEIANADAHFFNTFIENLPSGTKYTIIFSTTPSEILSQEEETSYEATFDTAVHMDLKRTLLYRAEGGGAKNNDTRPLFEKYQFLTPGLFMGIIVSILLLSILGVGLSAISGLQVSYGAFDKEMGPAAQKKAQ